MFGEFAARVDAPLLANMTEFGRTPFFSADEFQAMGYAMVIWPVSALRVAAKAQENLYAAICARRQHTIAIGHDADADAMYETIRYHEYESLDANIVETIVRICRIVKTKASFRELKHLWLM